MLTARLAARCPSVVACGVAVAEGYSRDFSKLSADRSGKATLVRSETTGQGSTGVLFEIKQSELPNLDRAEAAGKGYDRLDSFPVRLSEDGQVVHTTTYLAKENHASLRPYDWYLALMIAGAQEHAIGQDHVSEFRKVAFDKDRDAVRPSRLDALDALRKHGHHDYRALLGSSVRDRISRTR